MESARTDFEAAMGSEAKGFEEHAEAQRKAGASLPPLERLRWLQQAKEFACRHLGAAAKPEVRKLSR